MIRFKMAQAVQILKEKDVDAWLTFVRESDTIPDPMLELIVGTHIVWPSVFILTKHGRCIAIVGSLDAQNVKDHAPYEIVDYVDSIRDPLLEVLEANDPAQIAINTSSSDVTADGLTHGMYLRLLKILTNTPFVERLVSSESIVSALRGRKLPEEVVRIRAAVEETEAIFDEVSDFLRIGLTEEDVHNFIKQRMVFRNLEPAWNPEQCPAVFTGPESAGAHTKPTDRKIDYGHLLNIDFGVRKRAYVSDLQRLWYFHLPGETTIPADVEKAFLTVRDAVRKAAEYIKPGIEGWRVDHVARETVTAAGYPEYPHALGHQVGRKAHDGSALLCPKWERYGNLPYSPVEAGQVFTLEPRLFVEGHGTASLEEIILITDHGCEFLSHPQETLITK